MTTYKRQYLRNRIIGSGVETECYHTWEESREVMIFTNARNKWIWLNFLGLTVTPQRRVRKEREYLDWDGKKIYDHVWKFNTVKLEAMPSDYFYGKFSDLVNPELDKIHDAKRIGECHKLNPNDFNVFRPVIEFCAKYKIDNFRIDAHSGNYLMCPITKHVYPYDVFFIPDSLEGIN